MGGGSRKGETPELKAKLSSDNGLKWLSSNQTSQKSHGVTPHEEVQQLLVKTHLSSEALKHGDSVKEEVEDEDEDDDYEDDIK